MSMRCFNIVLRIICTYRRNYINKTKLLGIKIVENL